MKNRDYFGYLKRQSFICILLKSTPTLLSSTYRNCANLSFGRKGTEGNLSIESNHNMPEKLTYRSVKEVVVVFAVCGISLRDDEGTIGTTKTTMRGSS